jgi:hypothetical protein
MAASSWWKFEHNENLTGTRDTWLSPLTHIIIELDMNICNVKLATTKALKQQRKETKFPE